MKKIKLLLLLISFISIAESATLRNKLHVKLLSSVNYQCADKTKLSVRYYSLSDNSLYFVKIKLDTKGYTLPQTGAGSGVKYSDGHQMTWWTKGEEGTVYMQNDSPETEWPVAHDSCAVLKK